jgi:hypothetical protein
MRLFLLALASLTAAYVDQQGSTCTLYPESLNDGQAIDDAPSIHKAFGLCGHNGDVIFANHTFNINSVMNTTNLVNCDVTLRGELRWSTDIPYWLYHSYSVVFQNQSTAWLFAARTLLSAVKKVAGTTVMARLGIRKIRTRATSPVALSVSLSTTLPILLWMG